MSKRFGRNQRRRAREEIARLNESIEMDRGLMRHLSQRISDLRAEIERAKDLLPQGTILFEPADMSFHGPADSSIRIRIPVFGRAPTSPLEMDALMRETIKDVPLDVFLTDSVLDKLENKVHYNVLFSDGRWRYSVSRNVLEQCGPGEKRRLINQIGMRLATQLISEVCDE